MVRAASLHLSLPYTPGAVPATAWASCPLLHTHDTERVCQTTCRVMLSKIYGRHENDGKAELKRREGGGKEKNSPGEKSGI